MSLVLQPFAPRTPRQEQILAMASELADVLSRDAERYDRNNEFPHAHFDALRNAGYHTLTVPEALGGRGASLTETILAQEKLATGDGATALSIGWHLALIGRQAEIRTWPPTVFERICREVVQHGALLNNAASERETGSPSRGGRPFTTAVREGSGWVITGKKAFLTMAPVLRYAVVSAGIEGEEGGGWFLVPMDHPGVRVRETWDAMGMRATGSHDVLFEDVRVPPEALVEPFGPGRTCQINGGDGAGWGLLIPAVYLGIAQAARDFILDYALTRRVSTLKGPIADVPHIRSLLGEIEVDLLTARSLLYSLAERWDGEPERRHELSPFLGAGKLVVTNNAIRIVDRAMRIAGIAGLSRSLPLERYYRDVRAGLSNPPMDDSVLATLAETALRETARKKEKTSAEIGAKAPKQI
jgi:alkylation response protein AidB-like acyl-CoA dehydrogenase